MTKRKNQMKKKRKRFNNDKEDTIIHDKGRTSLDIKKERKKERREKMIIK